MAPLSSSTIVINIKDAPAGWMKNPRYVYIGRPTSGPGGRFGNPVVLGRVCPVCGLIHSQRGSAILCYRVWLAEELERNPSFRQAVTELHGKILVCFCKPRSCHGDPLANAADQLAVAAVSAPSRPPKRL